MSPKDYIFNSSQMPSLCVIDSNNNEHIYGDIDDVYELASVTKLITANVVSNLVEDNFFNFDDVIDGIDYLKHQVRLIDLLSHTSGLSLNGEVPQIEPRQKRLYSNLAFETLNTFVVNKLENEFGIRSINELFNDGLKHVLTAKKNNYIDFYGAKASGARANLGAIVALVQEMRSPVFVSPQMQQKMRTIFLPELRGVLPGWGNYKHCAFGTGYEIKFDKSPHWMGTKSSPNTFGHFGQAGVFVLHDPDVNISIVALGHKEIGTWSTDLWPKFVDEIFQNFI
ncbi:MAG: beta-lactamase family protein [Acidimicrobiia bacterium]|nr:beta-lactamase family protein [Acidimicrobiia bacterium]